MLDWLVAALEAVVGWILAAAQGAGAGIVVAAHWIATIPDGILGAILGAAGTQLFTSIGNHRRNRDSYRAPQRAAIGALVGAANEMKVSMTDALDHAGLTGRQTSDDASLESMNRFLRHLLGLDQAFAVAFLTVVDGPCYDKLVAAEKPFYELRRLANNPMFSRANTAPGFEAFMARLFTASNQLDVDLDELVRLAQVRLRASQPFFSRRPTAERQADPPPGIALK